MKVGITTFQWAKNYGAVLQAHALQAFLQSRGHEAHIIDYRPRELEVGFHKKWLAKSPIGCLRKWEEVYRSHQFEVFRSTFFLRTPEVFYSKDDLIAIGGDFDILITGSDQIWNPTLLSQLDGLFDLYFLSFARPKTQRISYAASFGHSDLSSMEVDSQKVVGEKLKKMDAISVRENLGVDLVRKLCGRTDAVQVADPTLLLDRGHYEEMAGQRKEEKSYLFSFMLHGLENDSNSVLCQIREKKNKWRVVKCDARKTALHKDYTLPSPQGWLRQIRDAKFVVTNSFHGTIFCLIFHIPFIVVIMNGSANSMNSRLTDLLGVVELLDRIIAPGDGLPSGILTQEIIWDSVDRSLDLMKNKSIDFLKKKKL